jgi:zinc and cadmium transporter
MTEAWVYAMISVVMVSGVSFVGLLIIVMNEQRLQCMISFLVSLAAGGLFGDAFLHLLPESLLRARSPQAVALAILAGIFAFFVIEKVLRWQHQHRVSTIHPLGYMNLVGDAVHNFIDGVLIGAAYLVSFPVGLGTTIAVILHEIPQELSDVGVLLHAGFSKIQAFGLNFLSATLAIVGAAIALLVGTQVDQFATFMLPFAAGGFIYIAGSDLLPELHRELEPARSAVQCFAMSTGIGLMHLFTLFE